jgi:serine/threonine protein phosphatase 1
MRTLVMGDIHGAYTAMVQCLDRAGFIQGVDRLIQLGDVVDRGPDSYECVEYLIGVPNLITLRGNHDDWLNDFITTGYHPGGWAHGGKATIQSYGARLAEPVKIIPKAGGSCKTSLEPKDIPERHQQFFANQQLYYIDEQNNCFVHGGFERGLPFFEQPSQNYYWNRTLWLEAMAFVQLPASMQAGKVFEMETSFNEIFNGHSPTTNWHTDQPMHMLNIWNLDTGASHNGRLTVMDVETKEYWQSDNVSELF